jgi:polygalacturonase
MVGYNHTSGFPTNASGEGPVRLGNKAIALKLCRNVVLRDITIFHGGHFAVLVTGCDNLTVDNVTMDTDRDGIDIDCCRNTTVSNCRINSPNDDALCPKSSYALGECRPTENLTIVNCQVSGFEEGTVIDGTMKPSKGHNGRIKFGTESSGGFRNCTVANCTFRSCRGLALEEVDGALMENITINNLTMMDVPDYAIYITTGKRNRTPNLTTASHARNIFISNVIADGVGKMSGIQIMGLPDVPVEGVRLDNIRLISQGGGTEAEATNVIKELGTIYPEPGRLGILPAYGVYARHVKDLELANINVSYTTNDLRSAAMFDDVQGLLVDNFKSQTEPGVKPAVFAKNVTGLTIVNSPGVSANNHSHR